MEKLLPKNIYIWGTGKRARVINEVYAHALSLLDVVGYIDNDKEKWGNYFEGKEIFPPQVLKEGKERKYILISNQFEEDIRKQIYNSFGECDCQIIEEDILSRAQLILRYENTENKEIREIVERLKVHPLEYFNYDFADNYKELNWEIFFDDTNGLFYTFYCNKKMYFSRDYKTREAAINYYRDILLEQDAKSPHLYLTSEFKVPSDAIVVDAGAAEGNFSLSIIDNVSKIYIFEPDKNWFEALHYTFEPYKGKVVLINKFLSNYINDVTTSIDHEIQEEINFIKMDIEGEEYYALLGAVASIAKSANFACAICTYHQEFAYDAILNLLNKCNIQCDASSGYMWFPDYGIRPPVLRKAILRGKKFRDK
ncbi:MAG: hypothetical protein HDR71_17150 [Lachnospiraceae bacterium]|nr:hypothetical protein [Lachnospiraceae bacterium]